MKDWSYKARFIIKNTIKNFLYIMVNFLSILGAFLTIAECVHWMFNSDIVYNWFHDYVVLILIVSSVTSFWHNRVGLKYEYFINGTDVKITIQVGDVLANNSAVIIPTNTTFDTIMEDEFISINSVQGQFQKKYFENNLIQLDELLEKGVYGIEYESIERQLTKCKRYPIGTASKITVDGKHFYFIAIADVNEYGKTINTKFENVQIALEGIWSQLESKGHIENLAIPLLGTGKAGIKDVTREKVIKEIVFSFVASSKERKITENLIINIHPSDLEHKDLNLKELDEYLKYMCKFRYSDVDSKIEGTAI